MNVQPIFIGLCLQLNHAISENCTNLNKLCLRNIKEIIHQLFLTSNVIVQLSVTNLNDLITNSFLKRCYKTTL